jgi:hypothetical protein
MLVALVAPAKRFYEKKGINMKNVKLTVVGGLLIGALIMPAVAHAKDDQKHGGLHIPPGHLPPPGKCRIWHPGTPPGHQPPSGDCRTLSRQLPPGALLVSRDRVWKHDDRPDRYYHRHDVYSGRYDSRDDHRYPRGGYDRRGYTSKREIREDIRDVREARKDVREDREQFQKNVTELKKDRAELRKDIRDGASRKEIRQDRREIRESQQKVAESRKELRQSQNKLGAAREELREDLRRR